MEEEENKSEEGASQKIRKTQIESKESCNNKFVKSSLKGRFGEISCIKVIKVNKNKKVN